MTLTIAGLLIVTLLVVKFVIKPVMVKAGQDNQDYYSGLYKWIEESVIGIKEIKIAGREDYFINGYADCGAGYVNAVQTYELYNSTPRLLIETIAIGGMIGYMLVVMATGVPLIEMMPQMSVLVAAAARLLPSANRINNYLTSIAYFESLEVWHAALSCWNIRFSSKLFSFFIFSISFFINIKNCLYE